MRYFSSFTGAGGLDFYIVLYPIIVIEMQFMELKIGNVLDKLKEIPDNSVLPHILQFETCIMLLALLNI